MFGKNNVERYLNIVAVTKELITAYNICAMLANRKEEFTKLEKSKLEAIIDPSNPAPLKNFPPNLSAHNAIIGVRNTTQNCPINTSNLAWYESKYSFSTKKVHNQILHIYTYTPTKEPIAMVFIILSELYFIASIIGAFAI
ncbi:hypothetical protein GAMM_100160 [Gammaproteobacteria bacterium]